MLDLSLRNKKSLICPFADTSISMKFRKYYKNCYPVGAIIHYTAGRSKKGDYDAENTIKYGLSRGHAYLLISSTGKIYQTHSLDRWGHHAGKSYYTHLGASVSTKLVGIEVCCAGKLSRVDDNTFEAYFNEKYANYEVREATIGTPEFSKGFYHKFTNPQEESLLKLLLWLKLNNPKIFDFDYVLGHNEVSRIHGKIDPGMSLSMTMPAYRSFLTGKYAELIGEKTTETVLEKVSKFPLKLGDHSPEIFRLQTFINDVLGFPMLIVDGIAGPKTDDAVNLVMGNKLYV